MSKIKLNSAIAILRVSSHRQAGNTSHDVQEHEVVSYCKQNSLELINIFKIIESAKDSENRKKYKSAMKFAIDNKIGNVLFYMQDRESRNFTDVEYNEKLARQGILRFHYVKDNFVLDKNSNETQFMMRDFQAVNNKQFSRVLSMKVNDAMGRKADSGWFPSNHVPLGYAIQRLRGEDGKELRRGSIIVPDPITKNICWVQREFELRAMGYSYLQIRNTCVDEGLVSPAKLKSYNANTVEKRIKNPFYRGKFLWKGEIREGKHKIIIPLEILRKIDEQGIARYSKRVFSDLNGVLAGGWLKCADCGCSIIYDPKVKKIKTSGENKIFHYYHCSNGRKKHISMRGMSVREDVVWDQLSQVVSSISISEEFAQEIANELNRQNEQCLTSSEVELQELECLIISNQDKQNKLLDLLMESVIDKDTYDLKIKNLKSELSDLKKKKNALKEGAETKILENVKSILELAKSAKLLWESRSARDKRDFLELLLSNPKLNGVNVEYDLRKPFKILAEMRESENWRSQGDLNPCILREREVS